MTDPKQHVRILNEWGIPNWRQASMYGNVSGWSEDRWRWEFFRRRADLREYFDRWAKINHKENIKTNEGRGPDDPGFTVYGRDEDAGRGIKDFDYGGVPNPRIGSQPAIFIMPFSKITYHLRYYDPEKRAPSTKSVLEAVGQSTAKEYCVWLQKNELVIKFDLNAPLFGQIETARAVLQKKQRAHHGKVIKTIKHKAKWLVYLRTLDARDAGATWQEITDVFFEEGILNSVKNPEGGYGPPPPQKARDKWESADALRFDF